MALNHIRITNAKPRGKAYKLADTDGLYLVVQANGTKLWRMAYPMIGSLPVSKISPQEALAVLRKVEATGRYESARRMRSVLSRVFRYAIATARADRDVAADLRGALITPKVSRAVSGRLRRRLRHGGRKGSRRPRRAGLRRRGDRADDEGG